MAIEKVYKRAKGVRLNTVTGYRVVISRPGLPNKKSPVIADHKEAKALEMEWKLKAAKKDREVMAHIESYPFMGLIEQVRQKHFSQLGEGAERYEVDLKMRIIPYFEHYTLNKITEEVLMSFKEWLIHEYKQLIRKKPEPEYGPLSDKSINHTLGTLRLIFSKAIEYKLIKKYDNPFNLKMLPTKKTNPKAHQNDDEFNLENFWDDPQYVKRFLEAARDFRYYRLYLTALETGMRLQELIGLGADQIDFESGKIKVHRQWIERRQRFGPTKTRKTRYIDFDPHSHFGLELKKAVLGTPNKDIVFPTSNGKHVTRHNIGFKFFRSICKKANVPQITFHGLRHTFASWYLMGSKSENAIYDLQYLLGHSDVEMTRKYTHWSKFLKRPIANMSAYVGHSKVR